MKKLSSPPSSGTPPSIIPLNYDYQMMSPSSSTNTRKDANVLDVHHPHDTQQQYQYQHHHRKHHNADECNQVDNQYNSLFGDPVPPPPREDFLGHHLDSHLYERSLARGVNATLDSTDNVFSRAINIDDNGERNVGQPLRLFSKTPYASVRQRLDSAGVNERLQLLSTTSTKLGPPDIQILPDSGGSSSEHQGSPNYSLLLPDNLMMRRPSVFNISSTPKATSSTEVPTTLVTQRRPLEFSEATRRVSNFSEDFKSNVGSLSQLPPEIPKPPARYTRQISNDSYSSSEWFKPCSHDFPEFTKMLKMRPSSRNVMSIKKEEMPMELSPVAAMINDSIGSSSGEDQRLTANTAANTNTAMRMEQNLPQSAPVRPPDPLPLYLGEPDLDFFLPQQYRRRKSSIDSLLPSLPPPPVPPAPAGEESKLINREISPVIFKESITTGADYRVSPTRAHKKTSFTIIAEKSPQSSRAQSPTTHHRALSSPFLGHGFKESSAPPPSISSKPVAKPRNHLQRKSLSSIYLKLPTIGTTTTSATASKNLNTSDDSPRPSVQFNITSRRSPSKVPQKGILQYNTPKESMSSSQDTLPLPLPLSYSQKMKSCDALPLITDPYRTSIPRLHTSQQDLRKQSTSGITRQPLKPNLNPTRRQRGLLRVINSADSLSRIPVRSNWASMDDLSSLSANRRSSLSPIRLKDRRSSSTSPERRSSTQTEPRSSLASDRRSSNLSSVTTSDFSFKRHSNSPMDTPRNAHRKSIFSTISSSQQQSESKSRYGAQTNVLKGGRPPRKIAKPTTLSPIIGTPNKDSSTPQSPVHALGFNLKASAVRSPVARRDSLSQIPVRNSPTHTVTQSVSNSRVSSHGNSRVSSRSNSPLKDAQLQLDISGYNSLSASRSPSRATRRTDSRPTSRAEDSRGPSRSTSQASTRQISQGPSRSNSRGANSRPNSRMDQAKEIANSRSNSRLSLKGVKDFSSPSPRNSPPRRSTVSRSPSPRKPAPIRKSISPGKKSRSPNQSRNKHSPQQQRRHSRSRIPARIQAKAISTVSPHSSRSPPKRGAPELPKLRRGSPLRGSQRKETPSAKKVTGSLQKPESSVRRTPSSVRKETAATKKQSNSLQKTSSNLKRESSLKKNQPTGTGAGRTAQINKAASMGVKKSAQGSTSGPKRQTSSTNLMKGSSDTKPSTQTAPIEGSIKLTDTKRSEGALLRQPSGVSLVKIGSKLNILDKKNTEGSRIDGKDHQDNTSDLNAHPLQITTALTNQLPRAKGSADDMALPVAILEKSQKTLENIQKTVTEATHEIHKTINENLTDLKSFESDMGKISGDPTTSPSPPSVTNAVENKQNDQQKPLETSGATIAGDSKCHQLQKASATPTQPIEASISIVNGSRGPRDNLQVHSAKQNVSASISDGGIGGGVSTADNSSGTSGGNMNRHDASEGEPRSRNAEMAERVSERAISVLPDVDCESANFQNYELKKMDDKSEGGATTIAVSSVIDEDRACDNPTQYNYNNNNSHGEDPKTTLDVKATPLDEQQVNDDSVVAGSTDPLSGEKTGSQEFLEERTDNESRGCCKCCSKLCMPCRRLRCSRCCRRPTNKVQHPTEDNEERVLSATSSTTTTNLEVVDEQQPKLSCWRKLNCCKRSKKSSEGQSAVTFEPPRMETIREDESSVAPTGSIGGTSPKRKSKCGACLGKVFCCRSVNKVEVATGYEEEVKKCCFCIPRRKKKTLDRSVVGSVASSPPAAWEDLERSTANAENAMPPQQGKCSRLCGKLLCCKKKSPPVSDSRRTSMKTTTAAPPEDNRRKLHVDLVEYNSKMKGAIPVMPLYLAWFCAICNTIIPGLGTLLSGFFCLCVGIPRFSLYDSAKARFGSLLINCIVAVAQLFCVLFCFVGWGWSIWWGTIMLKTAKKLSKIRKVEKLEMEEEQRQAEAAAVPATATATQVAAHVTAPADKDVEAGKT